jgi:hypothetical protein
MALMGDMALMGGMAVFRVTAGWLGGLLVVVVTRWTVLATSKMPNWD